MVVKLVIYVRPQRVIFNEDDSIFGTGTINDGKRGFCGVFSHKLIPIFVYPRWKTEINRHNHSFLRGWSW